MPSGVAAFNTHSASAHYSSHLFSHSLDIEGAEPSQGFCGSRVHPHHEASVLAVPVQPSFISPCICGRRALPNRLLLVCLPVAGCTELSTLYCFRLPRSLPFRRLH